MIQQLPKPRVTRHHVPSQLFSATSRGSGGLRRRGGGDSGAGEGVHESPTIHRTQYIMYYVCKFEILIAILPKAVAVTAESLTHPSSFSLGFPPKVPTLYVPYARFYNPHLIRNRSWMQTVHKARILRNPWLKSVFGVQKVGKKYANCGL